MRFLVLTILLAPILLTSCAAKKRAMTLANHKSMLMSIADNQDLAAEVKMDSLASSFVRMMNEGLSITNPKKGAQYVKSYTQQNKGAIEKIVEQIVKSSSDMDKGERTRLALRMVGKSYTKDLIQLIPKFSKKYAQIKFVTGLTKKVKKGLFSFGGNALRGLLEN